MTEEKLTVEISEDAHVYGEKNKQITGLYTCPKKEADRLIDKDKAVLVEDVKSSGSGEGELTVEAVKKAKKDDLLVMAEKLQLTDYADKNVPELKKLIIEELETKPEK